MTVQCTHCRKPLRKRQLAPQAKKGFLLRPKTASLSQHPRKKSLLPRKKQLHHHHPNRKASLHPSLHLHRSGGICMHAHTLLQAAKHVACQILHVHNSDRVMPSLHIMDAATHTAAEYGTAESHGSVACLFAYKTHTKHCKHLKLNPV